MSDTNVVQLREFNEVVRITGRKIEAVEQSDKKTKNLQIEVGKLLVELRERVDAGEVGELATWWEWFEDNRMLFRNIERKTAERYMWFAGDTDPEKKLADYKAAEAARLRNFRSVRTLQNNQEKSKPTGSGAAAHGANQKAFDANNVVRIAAPPKEPLPTEQMALVEQFVALFRQMTEEARDKALSEITALYRRWKEGEE